MTTEKQESATRSLVDGEVSIGRVVRPFIKGDKLQGAVPLCVYDG